MLTKQDNANVTAEKSRGMAAGQNRTILVWTAAIPRDRFVSGGLLRNLGYRMGSHGWNQQCGLGGSSQSVEQQPLHTASVVAVEAVLLSCVGIGLSHSLCRIILAFLSLTILLIFISLHLILDLLQKHMLMAVIHHECLKYLRCSAGASRKVLGIRFYAFLGSQHIKSLFLNASPLCFFCISVKRSMLCRRRRCTCRKP